ncbi:hypothetical protein C4573_03585 [Candidatus Woesearchaeota archaeon]|nr:MAG: hypothetical protein C4573_03585 [Candidatus Woesearchaeota archaeon]
MNADDLLYELEQKAEDKADFLRHRKQQRQLTPELDRLIENNPEVYGLFLKFEKVKYEVFHGLAQKDPLAQKIVQLATEENLPDYRTRDSEYLGILRKLVGRTMTLQEYRKLFDGKQPAFTAGERMDTYFYVAATPKLADLIDLKTQVEK